MITLLKSLENKIKSSNKFSYLSLIISIQVFSFAISYFNLFSYERCSKNLIRIINLANKNFEILYPKMCDEVYYFEGFKSVFNIYSDGYVYQDRQFYLYTGFLIYRLLITIFNIFQFEIETISILILTTFIIQVIVLNLSTLLTSLIIHRKFDRFYSIIYFLIILFSFEQRRYFFLPSNSTIYFLIFLFSIYTIQLKKINGFIFGLLFTISGYGIVGFLYQLITKTLELKNNVKDLLKNIVFFILPSLFFEAMRLLSLYLKGPEYGVRYHYNADVYQQFVWFLKSILNIQFSPHNECQNLNTFVGCYFKATIDFLQVMRAYLLIFIILIFFLYTVNRRISETEKNLFRFTVFSYVFILFQGLYGFRFIYYSIGYFLILSFCIFIHKINDVSISIAIVGFLSYYTISKNTVDAYRNLEEINLFEVILFLIILFLLFIKFKEQLSSKDK